MQASYPNSPGLVPSLSFKYRHASILSTMTRPLKIKDSEQQNQISIRQYYTLMCLPLKHNHLFMKELLPCLKALMREKIRGSKLANINEAFTMVFFCVLGNFDSSDITNTGLANDSNRDVSVLKTQWDISREIGIQQCSNFSDETTNWCIDMAAGKKNALVLGNLA